MAKWIAGVKSGARRWPSICARRCSPRADRGVAGVARGSVHFSLGHRKRHGAGLDPLVVICGDGPTDYISGEERPDPREAVRAFVARWREIASYMLRGQPHPTIELGSPKTWAELGPLLKSRAELLSVLVAKLPDLAEKEVPRLASRSPDRA